jgi:CBS domain-containing protein
MESPIKTPEQLLRYRPLRQILAAKGNVVHAVTPADTVQAAARRMASSNIGLVVVLDQGRLVGVLSERDCARRVVAEGNAPSATLVRDLMVRDVVTVTPEHTVPQCMALMHDRGLRHLPVVDGGKVIAVLSIRDLLGEIVAHHERVIRNLELERAAIMGGGSTY